MAKISNTETNQAIYIRRIVGLFRTPPPGTFNPRHPHRHLTFNSMASTSQGDPHAETGHSQSPTAKSHPRHRKSTRRFSQKRPPGPNKGARVKYTYTEETLQRALREIRNGTLDRKGALKKYGIPYTTTPAALGGVGNDELRTHPSRF